MLEDQFPPGTPVCVLQKVDMSTHPIEAETIGTVESWEDKPTGSWFAHGKNDRLWLKRLTLRKSDGELTMLSIDNSTTIARLEATSK
ncbi:MAG: hypothetical protein AABZ47_11395 [Planctomycetota bacterium]